MGTTDFGTQKLSFDYNSDATAKLFNNVNFELTPVGIYSGFLLTKLSEVLVQISSGLCFIQDSTADVGTRIETSDIFDLSVSSTTPYVILRFDWADAQNNFMDMLAVAYGSITADDLIVGRCIYNDAATEMATTFDYTRRSNYYFIKQKTEYPYLRVTPTEPASAQFSIAAGILNSSKGNLIIGSGNYPVGGLPNTTQGRIDLVYIDENGAVQTVIGADSSTPVAPRYGNRKVVAEIRRGIARTNVKGNEIFQVISSFDAPAITSDQLITDTNNLYVSTNVEDALQEIAKDAFTFKGNKSFTLGSVSITAGTGLVANTITGADGQKIQSLKKFGGTEVQYLDQTGKLINTIGADIPIADVGNVFTTDKMEEAIVQLSNGTMTIKGAKTFNDAVALSSTVNKITLTAPTTASTLTLADNATLTTVASGSNKGLTLTYSDTTSLTLPAGTKTLVASDGNIATATALANPRTIGISGKVSGTGVSFDGTGNITIDTDSASILSSEISDATDASTGLKLVKRDMNGDATFRKITSDIADGTAPLVITSTTKVTNLNSDMVDGYHVSASSSSGNIPVQGANAQFAAITVSSLSSSNPISSTIAVGTAPLTITSTTKVDNLNVDRVDDYHVSASSSAGNIPVQGNPATFTELFATTRLRIPNAAPSSPQVGDIWII